MKAKTKKSAGRIQKSHTNQQDLIQSTVALFEQDMTEEFRRAVTGFDPAQAQAKINSLMIRKIAGALALIVADAHRRIAENHRA